MELIWNLYGTYGRTMGLFPNWIHLRHQKNHEEKHGNIVMHMDFVLTNDGILYQLMLLDDCSYTRLHVLRILSFHPRTRDPEKTKHNLSWNEISGF